MGQRPQPTPMANHFGCADESQIACHASITGRIRAPEAVEYATICSKNPGVQPYGVGLFAISCVARINHPRCWTVWSIRRLMRGTSSRLFSRKKAFRLFKSTIAELNVCPPHRQQRKRLPTLRLVRGRGQLIGYENVLKAAPGRSFANSRWFSMTESSNTAGSVCQES